jgi:MoaA/NifB/PqqE/SkfB family radical SAM enzyme
MSRHFREFVAAFDPLQYPDCRLMMITNGLLLDSKFLDLMPGRFSWVGVSVDGACKATYERIRVGASWERLLRNIQLLVSPPRRDYDISILFTIMRSNFHDLPAMREFANSLGVKLSIHPVRGRTHVQNFDNIDEVDTVLQLLRKFVEPSASKPVNNLAGTIQFYHGLRKLLHTSPSTGSLCSIYKPDHWHDKIFN